MEQGGWPYPIEYGETESLEADVLVLGGGVAGCMAAIAAARAGRKAVLVEKGATRTSGAGGAGCDHWESAATNPCSRVSPEELTEAMLRDNDGFNNGVSHYIECREGWDRLLDLERMGGKIRDTGDEYAGAAFRDEATKLLFAYDYDNRYTLRIWGTTFKPAMRRELTRLGVTVVDRVMATSLLTEGGRRGARVVGATGIHARTGRFYEFHAKATVICTSRPARLWLFNPAYAGLSEFRPTQCIGDGHAAGWRAGAEFAMMEKSVRAEFSAAGRSFPPYAAGNNHNSWYAASIVDARGIEVPYRDRDGRVLESVDERFRPAPGQRFFLKGGAIDEPIRDIEGPEAPLTPEMARSGYELPLYADLTGLPEMERKVIWEMMINEEGKTRVPVHGHLAAEGFDPAKDVLQCYGSGWQSASFLPQERQLFGLPGGFMNDWELGTNLPGLYVAGDALYASNCFGHAATTGHYAGRHAAAYAAGAGADAPPVDRAQADAERARVLAPTKGDPATGYGWKELSSAIAKTMQLHCGDPKSDRLLRIGLEVLEGYERDVVPETCAYNPHELVRLLETFDVLSVAQLVLHACLARTSDAPALQFRRTDGRDTGQGRNLVLVRQEEDGSVATREVPVDWFGDLAAGYGQANPAPGGAGREG